MTTIFADAAAGVMVCDSRVTSGDQWWIDPHKIERVGDELIGFCGDASEGDRWMAWYKGGKNGPMPKIQDSSALILSKKGLTILTSAGGYVPVARGFMGMGSGGTCATAAFMAGADAETAVNIACQIDANSGGDVIVHKL
jgi:ATP-dependent protease HslVU (ClpYQ) peptidase subunit